MTNTKDALSKEQELTVESVVKEFKKVRTDAISEMFDNVKGGIYPTTKFFNTLDSWFTSTLQQFEKQRFEEGKKEGERHADWLGETLLDARKSGAIAALADVREEMLKVPITAYQQASSERNGHLCQIRKSASHRPPTSKQWTTFRESALLYRTGKTFEGEYA